MKNVCQSMLLFAALFFLAAIADADEINTALHSHFDNQHDLVYLSYESVDQSHSGEYGSLRYLVMDFNLEHAVASNEDVQRNVHSICSRVLGDLGLVRRLSDNGYDMISVSFDRQSQFDCL